MEGTEITTLFSNYFVKYRFTIEKAEIEGKIHLHSHHAEINTVVVLFYKQKKRGLRLFVELCVNFCHLAQQFLRL